MASNINPPLKPTSSIADFRFWCQKVLPLVYDDSLSYYEVLGKMVIKINEMVETVNNDADNVITLKDAFLELQTYVNNFFDDIDQLASYAERAETAQTAANTSAVNAATSASNASQSSLAAMDARDTAVAARQAAQASANNASTAATNANTKANEAAQSAITAQTAQASASQSATLAATDRSAAQTAASTATTKANEANTSATNAETSAENAAQSEANAEGLVNNIQENLDNIQQNTQDISELKESIIENNFEIIRNRETANAGFVNGQTGSSTSSDQWFCTDFIFTPSDQLTVRATLLGNGGFAFYDFNKRYISGVNGNNAEEYGLTPTGTHSAEFTVNVPENAYYIRICAYNDIETTSIYIKGKTTLTKVIEKISNAKILKTSTDLSLAINNSKKDTLYKAVEETEESNEIVT